MATKENACGAKPGSVARHGCRPGRPAPPSGQALAFAGRAKSCAGAELPGGPPSPSCKDKEFHEFEDQPERKEPDEDEQQKDPGGVIKPEHGSRLEPGRVVSPFKQGEGIGQQARTRRQEGMATQQNIGQERGHVLRCLEPPGQQFLGGGGQRCQRVDGDGRQEQQQRDAFCKTVQPPCSLGLCFNGQGDAMFYVAINRINTAA